MKTNYSRKLILLFFILISVVVQAENFAATIKGRVIDPRQKPVAYSTVALLNIKTRNIEKGTVCNEAGEYTNYENVDLDVINGWETRRLKISFNYRFGKNEFKTRANRSASSSEEESRSGK